MMKALLVNPWICDFAAYDLWLKPFGLLRVASVLRRWGWETALLDCLDRFDPCLEAAGGGALPRRDPYGRGKFFKTPVEKPEPIAGVERPYYRYGLPRELALRRLKEMEKPDLILLGTTMTYWYPGYFSTIAFLRETLPEVPVVLGGLYPLLCSEHARDQSGADVITTRGDWQELADLVAGCGFPHPDPPAGDEITPDYDLLRDRRALAIRTGLGCPHSCSYCAASRLEPVIRRRRPEALAGELTGYRRRYGTTDIAFYDNALLYDSPHHLDRILSLVLEGGIGLRFHTPNGLHARFLTPITAGLMQAAGFIQPRISLESSSHKRQDRTGGKVSNRDLVRALEYLEGAGYRRAEIIVYLMLGLPGQVPEEVERDIRFVNTLGATVSLAAFSPIPETGAYLDLVRAGVIPEDLDPLWQNNTVFSSRQGAFSLDTIRSLREMAGELNRELPGRRMDDKI